MEAEGDCEHGDTAAQAAAPKTESACVCVWVSGKGGVEVWRVGGRCRTKSKGLGNATPTGVDTAERECKEWVAKPQCSQRAGLHHTYRHTKGGV